jgi:sigma-B regulation protein RsbU (phosphoserine phosphatase)
MDTLEHAALSELRHNLRTAVNQVLGRTELLVEDATDARNTAALDALHQIASAARAALSGINEALARRDSVDPDEVAALGEKIRAQVERIENCLATLRESPEIDAPPEWLTDFDRISRAAALLGQFGDRPAAGGAIAAEAARQDTTAGSARLLVVDNNGANRNILCRRLERLGYAVEEAPNGDVALDRIATEPFDIVLLDTLMPVMDGLAVLDRMRRDRRMRTVAVVAISSLEEAASVARAIEMGAEDYLFRPFHPVLLRTRIEAVLERKRLSDDLAIRQKAG